MWTNEPQQTSVKHNYPQRRKTVFNLCRCLTGWGHFLRGLPPAGPQTPSEAQEGKRGTFTYFPGEAELVSSDL